MKKMYIAASLLCLTALFCRHNVFADTLCTASIDDSGNISLSIVSDLDKEQLYTVYIMDENAVLNDKEGTEQQDGIIRLEQVTSSPDKDKRYNNTSMNIKIDANDEGSIYKAVIGGGELSGETLKLVYPAKSLSQQALSAVLSADDKTMDTVLNEYQDKVWSLDLDNDFYKSHKNEICRKLVEIIKEKEFSIDKTEIAFNSACILAQLAHCDKSDFYNILLKNEYILGVKLNSIIYSEKDSIAEAFINLRDSNPLISVSDLEKILRKAEALGILNESTRENVLSILNEYNDVFNLNFDGDYKNVDSYLVLKKMVPFNIIYKSISEVQTTFNSAVSDAGGNSGGNGGGNFKASTGIVNVADSSGNVTSGFVESMTNPKSFDDISEAGWAEVYINYLQSRNVISGYGNGKVYPNAAVTREEFLKMLISAMNPELSTEEGESAIDFVDVNKDVWYSEAISKAVKLGIVYGMDDNTFGIGRQITREDAAVMLYRAVETKKNTLAETAQPINFNDEADISKYAVNPVKTMQIAGVISGYEDGNFLPKNSITRAESAKMIYSILKNLNEL